MNDEAVVSSALAYAHRGWRVFPCQWQGAYRKQPLTAHGKDDATADLAAIRRWWSRWPRALIGTATGYGFAVLDIDPRHGGPDTLKALGFTELPLTPRARTAGGGKHLYFAQTDPPIGVTQGERGRGIGKGLDWRGVGGYVILPAPGTGYEWEVADVPMAPVPPELMPKAAPLSSLVGEYATCDVLTEYGEAALRSAAHKIMDAPNGEQEATLNGECYSIGRLAGAGGVPRELALDILVTAAKAMPSYDRRRPWRPRQVEEKVRRAFAEGVAVPRSDGDDVERERCERMQQANDAALRGGNDA